MTNSLYIREITSPVAETLPCHSTYVNDISDSSSSYDNIKSYTESYSIILHDFIISNYHSNNPIFYNTQRLRCTAHHQQ